LEVAARLPLPRWQPPPKHHFFYKKKINNKI